MTRTLAGLVAAVAVVAAACSSPSTEPDAASGAQGGTDRPSAGAQASDQPGLLEPSEPYGITTVTLSPPDGTETFRLEVYDAYWPATRQKGLMGRAELPDGTGMVFRYPDDHNGGFWMKDTLIPLSIAYFDAQGIVGTVLDMEPCTADPCPGYPPTRPYRGTLEVKQGYFAEIGLTEGWRVELPPGLPPPQA
jgi:hypothetical protein